MELKQHLVIMVYLEVQVVVQELHIRVVLQEVEAQEIHHQQVPHKDLMAEVQEKDQVGFQQVVVEVHLL